MNFIYRIGIGSIACIAVACSKDATETAAPVAEPETVIIGCSGATGADVDVRTQLEKDGLSVRWSQGDEIRLWAREHKEPADASPTYVIENLPFRFYYYSPSWSRAGFKGTISGVESKFERAKKYDYFAVSPAPASDADVDAPADGSHINVTYTIPAEQTGEFDGRYDIMTAKPLTAQGLQAGDDNPSVNLVFHHHIHLLKFTIASSKWEANRPIRAVRLTFPCPVVGRLTVDATDPTVNELTALADDEGEGKTVLIEFPEGQEKDVGDTFYAMIAPVSFESGETETESGETGSSKTIRMQIIGTLGETSVDLPIADKDDNTDKKVNPTLAAGRSTLINLNVKAMNPYKTVTLKFNVVDNDRSEFAGVENKLGVNTLGERVHTVRVIGPAGAFSNYLEKSGKCSVSKDGSTLTYDDKSEDGDGVFSLTFLSKKLNPDYLWPDEELLWDDESDESVLGQTLEVEYDSDRALIISQNGWKPVQTSIPSIPEGQTESYESVNTLSVPYLFEEDFSKVNGLKNKLDLGSIKSASLGNDKFCSSGWSGFLLTGYSNSIELKSKIEYVNLGLVQSYGRYYGRLDSADILNYLKDKDENENEISSADIKIYFEYGDFRSSATNEYEHKLFYNVTHNMDVIDPYYVQTGLNWGNHNSGNNIITNETPLPASGVTFVTNDFDNCKRPARLSWQLTVSGEKKETDESYLHIKNVRVSLR